MNSAVATRLGAVRARIEAACARVGRPPESVSLVAVSKRHPPEAIREAYAAGHRCFGENYVQELHAKAAALSDLPELQWRFIGSLQRNKAGVVAELGCTVDCVDSGRLALALDRRATAAGRVLEVLLQVNVGLEPQKAGVAPEEAAALAARCRELPGLALRGLMAIPPAVDDPEMSRPHFATLRALTTSLALPVCSMGMSADLDAAIEEGATMVRVGTAIFGPRPG